MPTTPDKNGTSYQQIKHDYMSGRTKAIIAAVWFGVLVCIAATWPEWCVFAYLAGTVAILIRKLFAVYRSPRA